MYQSFDIIYKIIITDNLRSRKNENILDPVDSELIKLHKDILSRDNNLVYMQFKSLLSSLGYKRRSKKVINNICNFFKENNIAIYHDNTKKYDLYNIPYSDYITLRYLEKEIMDYKFYYDHAGKIKVAREVNPISLYYHQREAIKEIDKVNQKNRFSGILAISTGGGKTLTAIYWLLKNAIDQNKKVLWIAHRHELLSQAFLAVKQLST